MEERNTKTALIQAGIREIREYGLSGMSMRRIAAACGVSCATPYKHFKNRDEFILAIFSYIHHHWSVLQGDILDKYDDPRLQIVETCMAYIRFLCDNPDFRSILFLQDESLSREQRLAKSEISIGSKRMVAAFCHNMNIDEEEEWREVYIIRSMLYGAAFMLSSGELVGDERTYGMIRSLIEREIDIVTDKY
ncbi:MAG: TetR/AcrR family transcriptional regulator [Clostridia bacterium]|nr:TetR/AcrR family transcriptional regulator [Clostridia bacterium]